MWNGLDEQLRGSQRVWVQEAVHTHSSERDGEQPRLENDMDHILTLGITQAKTVRVITKGKAFRDTYKASSQVSDCTQERLSAVGEVDEGDTMTPWKSDPLTKGTTDTARLANEAFREATSPAVPLNTTSQGTPVRVGMP